jgi:hypothetical protein
MALQFRRGAEADLPSPTDASIGEPLFTTDSGKLFVKKADGTYAEISGSGSTNIDLSDIDAGSMVKVNPSQDGFVAAAGGDVPSHTHTAEAITSGTLPSAVAYPTAEGTGFSNAVEARLLVELPTAGGALDIAQESTLLDLGNDIDGIDTRVTALENAPDGVDLSSLTSGDVVKVSTVNGVKVLASATNEQNTIESLDSLMFSNTGEEEGYLKFVPSGTPGLAGSVSFAPAILSAPEFIDGGGADADNPT